MNKSSINEKKAAASHFQLIGEISEVCDKWSTMNILSSTDR